MPAIKSLHLCFSTLIADNRGHHPDAGCLGSCFSTLIAGNRGHRFDAGCLGVASYLGVATVPMLVVLVWLQYLGVATIPMLDACNKIIAPMFQYLDSRQ